MRFLIQQYNPVNNRAVAIGVIILLGFAAYANSLSGKFLWDDEVLIRQNQYIKNVKYLPKIFITDMGVGFGRKSKYYRPVFIISLMMDYAVWELCPLGYRITTILSHILMALALYWFIGILCNNSYLAFVTSLLFVLHPIHTEVAAYITSRANSLMALFMVLAFISYIKHLKYKKISTYILTLFCFILSLLSKEISLIFPVLLLLYHFIFKKKLVSLPFLSTVGVIFIYFVIRVVFLQPSKHSILLDVPTVLKGVPTFFAGVTKYITLLFVPFDLHMWHQAKTFYFNSPETIVGIIITFLLLVYAFKQRVAVPVIFFAIYWFFLTLTPTSVALLNFSNSPYIAERYLYLPSVGFCLIIANIFYFIHKKECWKITGVIFMISLVSFYVYRTISQNNYWKEPISFYERTLRYNPGSVKLANNLGIEYNESGQYDKAMVVLEGAIRSNPHHPGLYLNLSNSYFNKGEYEKAKAALERAIEINPGFAQAHINLSNIYRKKKDYHMAAVELKKAIQINPRLDGAYYNLGLIYLITEKTEEAEKAFQKAVDIDPNNVNAYNNLSVIYVRKGKGKAAIEILEKAVRFNPNYSGAYAALGKLYEEAGRKKDAAAAFKKAITIYPDFAEAHNELGKLLFYENKYGLAEEHFKKAKSLGYKIDPKFLEFLQKR